MNNYKVRSGDDATALARYWQSAYGMKPKIIKKALWWELEPTARFSERSAITGLWRNINDAFIGGRRSTENG